MPQPSDHDLRRIALCLPYLWTCDVLMPCPYIGRTLARRVYVDNHPGDVVVALAAVPEGSGGDGLVSAFPEDCNRWARYIEGCRPFVRRYNAFRSNLDRKTELLSLRPYSG